MTWLNEALNVVSALMLAVPQVMWEAVNVLAGGPNAPWWRWVLVEEGILLALIAVAGILGRWVQRRFYQQFVIRWSVALLLALPFGIVWAGYSLLMSQAMNVALHPATAREVFTFTWALPMTIALPAYSFGGLAMQVGAAAAISTVILVYVGEALAWNHKSPISRYN